MKRDELKLFEKEEINFSNKFYILMNLLVSNQYNSFFEYFLFLLIFSLQMITSFFSENIKAYDIENNTSDKILNIIEKIVRGADILKDDKKFFEIFVYMINIYLITFITLFLHIILNTSFYDYYNLKHKIINIMIKTNLYVLFNVINSIFFLQLCFDNKKNSNDSEIFCTHKENIALFIVSLINMIIINLITFLGLIFYTNCFFVESNPYSHIISFYDFLLFSINLILTITLNLVQEFKKTFFFIINILLGLVLIYYFISIMPYSNSKNNFIWLNIISFYTFTGIYSFIFNYINLSEKGLFLLISLIILCLIIKAYFKLFENKLFNKTPFYLISNNYFLLYYIREIYYKIIEIEFYNKKSQYFIIGIIQIHMIECPNAECITKKNSKLYLPINKEWSDRSKPFILDKIFLKFFILSVFEYFIKINYYCPQMILNISLYYLNVIGNYCKSFEYYQKVKYMKLNICEYFSLKRLEIKLRHKLNEQMYKNEKEFRNISKINFSLYFKYRNLSYTLYKEIINDINLNIKFWNNYEENKEILDFNRLFLIIDLIQKSKKKVEQIWDNLFDIYIGINNEYELYLDYIEQINDDNNLKRYLETIGKKSVEDNLEKNYYNILFSSETGICLLTKDGIIKKVNKSFCEIFKCDYNKIIHSKINKFMPKLIQKNHDIFLNNFFENYNKKIVDKEIFTYALTEDKYLIKISKITRIFPVLNNELYFMALINLENIEDIILIDNEFNIDGMSKLLYKKLRLKSNLFNDYSIPFYVICKKFINFYKIFLKGKKNNVDDNNKNILNDSLYSKSNVNEFILEEKNLGENDFQENNFEINENMELEYDITIPRFVNILSKINSLSPEKQKDFFSGSYRDNEILIEKNETFQISHKKKSTKKFDDKLNVLTLNTESLTPSILKKKIIPKINFNFINNEEKEENMNIYEDCLKKLKLSKDYFFNDNYEYLENLIDNESKGDKIKKIKFNFTFQKVDFGNNYYYFLVRCIDNKDEDNFDSNSEMNLKNTNISYLVKNKICEFISIFEINPIEIDIFNLNEKNFITIKNKDNNIQNLLKDELENMKLYSRVHGTKKENNDLLDENASQTSNSSFNNNLSRIEKINEKKNLIHKQKKFVFLERFRKIPLLWFFISIFFGILIYYHFFILSEESQKISIFNNEFYLMILYTTQIQNNFLDIYYLFINKNNNFDINNYIGSNENYFDFLSQNILDIYKLSLTLINKYESNIHKYINMKKFNAWYQIYNEFYYNIYINSYENIPFIESQSLYNAYSFCKIIKYNSINYNSLTEDQKDEIMYNRYQIIEICYNYLMPTLYSFLPKFFTNFLQYNKDLKKIFIIIIIIYSLITFITIILIDVILFKGMYGINSGFAKVDKIPKNMVSNVITKLENFKLFYQNKFEDENNLYLIKKQDNQKEINIKKENNEEEENNNKEELNLINKNVNSNGFSFDSKKMKRINIIFQIQKLAIFILLTTSFMMIILFLNVDILIDRNSSIIYGETYMNQILLQLSTIFLTLKCTILKCNITTTLEYNIIEFSYKTIMIKSLNKFPYLQDFYYNKYISDLCATIYDNSSDGYINCKNNEVILSMNNTPALIEIFNFSMNEIFELYNKNLNNNESYDGFDIFNLSIYNLLISSYYNFLMPIAINQKDAFETSFKEEKNKRIKYFMILGIIWISLMIYFLCYTLTKFLNKMKKIIITSMYFIKVIPTNYILKTPDLENWLENINISK